MKKISLGLLLSLVIINPSLAEITTSEAVDLYKNNAHFISVVKAVDDLKIIDIYPDHTFRGEKSVNRKELAAITLKLIKFIESEKKVSLIKNNESSVVEVYPDLDKDKQLLITYSELTQSYSINLLSQNDKNFIPQKAISKQDLVNAVNQVLELYFALNKNPYEAKTVKANDINSALDNFIKCGVITDKKQLKLNEEITRYELSDVIIKITNYIRGEKVKG